MSRRKPGTRSSKTHVYTLIAISILVMLLPAVWTGKLSGVVQLIVPFQHAATSAADSVADALERDPRPVSSEVHEALERRAAALEHQVAALAAHAAELENEVEILTGTRLWEVNGRFIGARGQLIPARVVSEDLLPWRESRLVNAGTLQGVRRGSAVVSQFFTIDQGETVGVGDGMALLLREVLVGFVEQTSTHTSRVRLLSDLKVGRKVKIGRLTDERFTALDRYFWLTGRGSGIMEIREVDRRDIEAGRIRPGDSVLSDPMSNKLPAAMIIGRIASIDTDRKNPLLSILTVKSELDDRSLRRVYVYVPEPASAGE